MRNLTICLLLAVGAIGATSPLGAVDILYNPPATIETATGGGPLRLFTFAEAVDMDKDGDKDLLYTNSKEYSIKWLENIDGQAGVYTVRSITKPGSVIPLPETPIAVDLDGDGDLDIVATGTNPSVNPQELAWFENDGNVYTGSWKKRTIELKYYRYLFALNLNNDDRPDLLGFKSGSGAYYLNSGGNPADFPLPPTTTSIPTFNGVRKTDLDSDGKPDFLFVYGTALTRMEVERGGTPTFTTTSLTPADGLVDGRYGLPVFEVADLDGDGLPEFIYAPDLERHVVKVKLNVGGTSVFGSEIALGVGTASDFTNIDKLISWDMDDDGDLDLMALTDGQKSYFLRNQGGGGLNFEPVSAAISMFHPSDSRVDVVPYDYDEDGDLDLIANTRPGGAATISMLTWNENLCDEAPLQLTSVGVSEMVNDNALQPGEIGALELSVRNLSAIPVSTATLDLSGSTSGILFSSMTPPLETIPNGADVNVQVPFVVSDLVTCGSYQTFQVQLKLNGTSLGSGRIDRRVGAFTADPVQTAHADEGVSTAIPDGNSAGVSRRLSLPAAIGAISEVRVGVNISHPYRGDLLLKLVSPQGTSRTLFTGGPTDFANDIVQTFTLQTLDGEGAAGVYTLEVSDRITGDTGTLNSWSLDVDYAVTECQADPVTGVLYRLLGIEAGPDPTDNSADGRLDAADVVAGRI